MSDVCRAGTCNQKLLRKQIAEALRKVAEMKKSDPIEDLRKVRRYLDQKIVRLEKEGDQ